MKKERFDSEGNLIPGTHVLTVDQFLQLFCTQDRNDSSETAPRHQFYKPFIDINEWAEDAGATSIIIGGSFVTKKENPSDIDVLIFFATGEHIPTFPERFYVDGAVLDVQLLSEDQPLIKNAYLDLLATKRNNVKHGIVQIKYSEQVQTHLLQERNSDIFEIVKTAYLGRKFAKLNAIKGVVIPIHGIQTHADWLPELSFLLSSTGWAVAPYVYGYQSAKVLGDSSEKIEIVEGFRDWIAYVKKHYEGPISIVAHSFGTYIVGRYLEQSGDLCADIDCIILSGSILNQEFDWSRHLDKGKVGKVLNTISESDEYVKFMPEGGVPFLAKDPLFGSAGRDGFSTKNAALIQQKSKLLRHNNIFKSDVILSLWMPFLNLNKNSLFIRQMNDMIEKFRSGA